VVTANKAMLALHGPRLAGLAEENNATIGWEAAVGGGIPCIKALKEGIAANNITYAAGIMNGAQHRPWHFVGSGWLPAAQLNRVVPQVHATSS
jgi:homoserine dehydrogenase